MMNLIKSFLISFSMYSIIPMPNINWEKENMKYTFLFFPWIGLIIGALSFGWFRLAELNDFQTIFASVILALIPIVISGGIHMDGLIDTCDAIFSYGDKAKKIEILDDPRTGAFGVQGFGVYLLLIFGIYSQIFTTNKYSIVLIFVFLISRAIGAMALLSVKKAKTTGLGATFSGAADNKKNLLILSIYLLIAFILIGFVNVILCISILVVLFIYIALYIRFIMKSFGGISGDLTGFLVSTLEVIMLAVIMIGGMVL